ncbi:YjhG/YagF family D-xylonate dehydratase [Oleiharenicola lentus]|uniref:YjhG/YagF family D-xylonate dehydratase n=1 Tax=Oleiharenicola lentus TaxID=2508720 RepID=A0A4Q1C7P6_9BACT|nr:YjhG/YagF family D-xylonate dehydratase [Oleiharenicola lentus]RXK54937.1 YjhG/YagF family D-xylonate dehydratase [Oleiharenicola lentus]
MSDPILDSGDDAIYTLRTTAPGPAGSLPLDAERLRRMSSGELFGWTQNAGMGWSPAAMLGKQFLILSTQGGIRAPDGSPIALGYHTGHWEVGLLMEEAARVFASAKAIPFAGYVSDPCDGRTNGTNGMLDSLPYRNDAAMVLRRLIRSLPTRRGVLGVATCDKGLPAMLMALAGSPDLPTVLVPGGVTLLAEEAEDTGKVQTLATRFARDEISLEHAAEMGCKACGSPGGGCQFMGTAATSQVVAEALGLALPHSALAPSGSPIWRDVARRSARALLALDLAGTTTRDLLTDDAIHNAMVCHAAFGGSTNLVLHVPAIAHAAGLRRPTVDDWARINRAVPRIVDSLPNGPRHFATVQVYLAGGVPEAMLHLRDLGLLKLDARTATGRTLGDNLAWWEKSERRTRLREKLRALDGIDPGDVIMAAPQARARGLTSCVTFLRGNLAPEGALVKSTAIAPQLIGDDGIFQHEGPARVFTSENHAIAALKAGTVKPSDVMVLAGIGPGCGMPETYQVTSALKHMKDGQRIALITDGRFSGVSTGACVGHVSPEAWAGGPLGKLRDGDTIRLRIDTRNLEGSVDVVSLAAEALHARPLHPGLHPNPHVPTDTRLWSALQNASGGTWAGCVYDAERIAHLLQLGLAAEKSSARVGHS